MILLTALTHRRILTPPSSMQQAIAFLDALFVSDSFRLLSPDAAHWTELRALLATELATGNLAFDAQIAAVCVRHGAVLLTHDRDFAAIGIKTIRLS